MRVQYNYHSSWRRSARLASRPSWRPARWWQTRINDALGSIRFSESHISRTFRLCLLLIPRFLKGLIHVVIDAPTSERQKSYPLDSPTSPPKSTPRDVASTRRRSIAEVANHEQPVVVRHLSDLFHSQLFQEFH